MDTEHHLFLSYARKDNQPKDPALSGWVTAFHDRLVRDHREFSGRPLIIFFDRESIITSQYWETRIRQGLRSSRLFVAFLSPNFFDSEWCKREWRTYVQLEHRLSRTSAGILPIYFHTVPGLDAGERDELIAEARALFDDCRRRQRDGGVDLRSWFPEGPQALRELDAAERLAEVRAAPVRDEETRQRDFALRIRAINQHIARRLDEATLAEFAEGNGRLTEKYSHFVGRTSEIAALHQTLSGDRVSLISALHGLGGQGKTALAVQYAYAYASYYACGGRWITTCEGKTELVEVFADLAAAMRIKLSEAEERLPPRERIGAYLHHMHGRAAAKREELLGLLQAPDKWRTPQGERAVDLPLHTLLVLDNVDKAELLAAHQMAAVVAAPWLDLIVTTRLGPEEFGAAERLAPLPVGDLPPLDALALLEELHPFADADDRAAGEAIVEELDGFTLAIELIGAEVAFGAKHGASYAGALAALRASGSAALEQVSPTVRDSTRADARAKTIAAIVERVFTEQLSAEEQTTLHYASLFPADLVATDWLRPLVAAEHPALAPEAPRGIGGDPWLALLDRLDGRRLLVALPLAHEHAEPTARMHRLLVPAIIERMTEETREQRLDALVTLVDYLGTVLEHQARFDPHLPTRFLGPLTELTLALIAHGRHEPQVLRQMGVCADVEMAIGRFAVAGELYRRRIDLSADWLVSHPQDGAAQRDLSVSQTKLGDFHLRRGGPGDADAALDYYRKALASDEARARANPEDGEAQRDLSVSQNRLGDFHLRRGGPGDADAALDYYRKALATDEARARANPEDGEAQRDLSVSQERLGDFHLQRGGPGDAETALDHYLAAAAARRALAAQNPDVAELWAELSVPLRLQLYALARLDRQAEMPAVLDELAAILRHWDSRQFEPDPRIEAVRELLAQLSGAPS